MTRPRVLIADDHPGFAKALSRVLAFDCDIVEVVADGGAVIDAVARHHPVVALVDVNLPNVSGLEICRRLTARNPPTKVIIITGMLDDPIRDAARAAGATAVLPKLTAARDLVAEIARAWSGSA